MGPRQQIAGLVAIIAIAAYLPSPATAMSGAVSTSRFGIEPVAVGQADDLGVAVWGGGLGGGSILGAEHRTGDATWTRSAVVGSRAGDVFELDLAAGRRGDAVAVWTTARLAQGTVRLEAARRRRGGAWSTPTVLTEFTHTGVNLPSMLPVQTADVEVSPDGGALVVYESTDGMVVSRSLAPGQEVWDAPQTIRPAPPEAPGLVPDVAVTLRPDGRAVAAWQQGAGPTGNRSIGVAERIGDTWSTPATLCGLRRRLLPGPGDHRGRRVDRDLEHSRPEQLGRHPQRYRILVGPVAGGRRVRPATALGRRGGRHHLAEWSRRRHQGGGLDHMAGHASAADAPGRDRRA